MFNQYGNGGKPLREFFYKIYRSLVYHLIYILDCIPKTIYLYAQELGI